LLRFTATPNTVPRSSPVAETHKISDDINIDIDADGWLVSMTIEYAKTSASIKDFSY